MVVSARQFDRNCAHDMCSRLGAPGAAFRSIKDLAVGSTAIRWSESGGRAQ